MTTVHNLTPSPLRTVTLQSCTGLFAQVMWTPKASADCLDYVLDFSTLLAGTGDTLTAIRSAIVTTAAGSAYDLKVMWSAVAGPLVMAFLASGQPNTAQKILFEITTQQGRVYSVMAVLQITALTVATAPPSDFPADTLTNGEVLIAGIEALPSGYSSNGRVVMATEDAAPVGTPSFESVTAGTYSGDGSGLHVTSGSKVQTIGQWIAALSSGGAQGVGIKEINVTQGAVVAGQASSVTLTATLTDGTTTAPAAFEVPTGSDANVTAANIKTALGYAPANGENYLPIQMSSISNIPTLAHPTDTQQYGNPAFFRLSDWAKDGNTMLVGYSTDNNYSRFTLMSEGNFPPCITMQSSDGNAGYIFLQTTGKGDQILASQWIGLDGTWSESGIAWVEKDNPSGAYWKISAPQTGNSNPSSTLDIFAGNADNSAYQATPAVSISKATNQATFANEPLILTTYTFATLPTSPVAWQRALVTDKGIGSGPQGVMAMWNPNTKAWTGLSGEALV